MTTPNQSPATPSPSLPDDGATPRTDALVLSQEYDFNAVGFCVLARQLERELNAARNEYFEKGRKFEADKGSGFIAAAASTVERLESELAAAESLREDQMQALGLANDEHTVIAAEIRRIRDEGRAYFHELAAAQRELEATRKEDEKAHTAWRSHMSSVSAQLAAAEEQLRIIGDLAVADWNDKTVGAVDAALKDSPFDQRKYSERVRSLFDRARRTETAEAQLSEAKATKDSAYLERNQVVAALASAFPSGIAKTAIEGWDEAWHGCVYIDLPTGQASWHYHESQAHLFAYLPAYTKAWDGHSTEEKYRRLAALRTQSSHAEELAKALEEMRSRWETESSEPETHYRTTETLADCASEVSTALARYRSAQKENSS